MAKPEGDKCDGGSRSSLIVLSLIHILDPIEQPFQRRSMRLGKEKVARVRRDAEGLVAKIEVVQKQVFIPPLPT